MDERTDEVPSKRCPAAHGAGESPDEASGTGSARPPTTPRNGRLLPWSGPEGKPCYLFTDDSDGFLSRMADDMETMQLRMAEEIVEFAGEARADGSLL